MTKQEFFNLCDHVFTKHSFHKYKKNYYLDLGSDLIGSIIFQSSAYSKAYYLEGSFSYREHNSHLPYPKLTEVDLGQRIMVPCKELFNGPSSHMTTIIKYDQYTEKEIETYLENALMSWILPAIQNGVEYILSHEDIYSYLLSEARALGKLKN